MQGVSYTTKLLMIPSGGLNIFPEHLGSLTNLYSTGNYSQPYIMFQLYESVLYTGMKKHTHSDNTLQLQL